MKTTSKAFQTLRTIFAKSLTNKTLPSTFFRKMSEEELVRDYKPVAALKGNLQRVEFHPEKDCLEHTFQVLDATFLLLMSNHGEKFSIEEKVEILFSAFVHDVGKALTQVWNDEKKYFTHIGHEKAGVEIVEKWLHELGEEAVEAWSKTALFTTEFHGLAHTINDWGYKKIINFAKKIDETISMDKYVIVVSADYNGRVSTEVGFLENVKVELHPNASVLKLALVVEDMVRRDKNNLLNEEEIKDFTNQVMSNTKIPEDKRVSTLNKRLEKEQEKKFTVEIERLLSEAKYNEEIDM